MDISKKALLLIDLQLGGFDGERIPAITNENELIANIQSLISTFRKNRNPIIFIQDNGDQGGAFEKGSTH